MLSLSIIPYDGALSLDAQQPIVARRKSLISGGAGIAPDPAAKRPSLQTQRRHVSFASPLSSSLANQRENLRAAHTEGASAAEEEHRLGIRLAAEDILVPAVDRCQEVVELLFKCHRNAPLLQQLETLFRERHETTSRLQRSTGTTVRGVDDWSILKRLLTSVSRERMPDRAWLTAICQIVAPRSAKLWCSLSDCLGTGYIAPEILVEVRAGDSALDDDGIADELLEDGMALDEDISAQSGEIPSNKAKQTSIMSPRSKSRQCQLDLQVLHEIPADYRKTPTVYFRNRPSAQDEAVEDDEVEHDDKSATNNASTPQAAVRRRHSSVSSGHGLSLSLESSEQVRALLETNKNRFAGLRFNLETPATKKATETEPTTAAGSIRPRSLSSGVAQTNGPIFKKFRRLSSLFLPGIEEARPARPYIRTSISDHGRRPSTSKSAATPARPVSFHEKSSKAEQGRQLDVSPRRGSAPSPTCAFSPISALSARKSTTPSRHQCRFVNPCLSMSSVVDKSQVTQGHSRNPSGDSAMGSNVGSGSEDSDDSRTSGKRHLTGLMPDGRTRHPSSGSQDSATIDARDTFRADVAKQRANNLTPRSSAEDTLSPLSVSCASIKTPSDGHSFLSSGFEMSPLGLGIADMDQSMMSFARGDAELSGYAIMRNSLPHLERMRATSDSVLATRRAAKGKAPAKTHEDMDVDTPRGASALIFPVPPCARFSRVHELTLRMDEAREKQEEAWRIVQEALSREDDGLEASVYRIKQTIARCGERRDLPDEGVVESIARQCFRLVDMRSSAMSHGHDDEIEQANFDAYLHDVEGYERRWRAFKILLRDIWLVDDAVLHKVKERCGPAQRLDVSSLRDAPATSSSHMDQTRTGSVRI